MKKKILFVGLHNSGRSQIAEAMLNRIASHEFEAQSAGLDPAPLNLIAVEVMKEIGLDISGNKANWVYDFIQPGKSFAYVITVCDDVNARRCPKFNGKTQHSHWSFPDLSKLRGTRDEQMTRAREIRDMIGTTLTLWCKQVCSDPPIVAPGTLLSPGQSPFKP